MDLHSNAQSSHSELRNPNNGDETQSFFDDFESACSTPYVSAPSSPGRSSSGGGGSVAGGGGGGFFYSAPASPIHFARTSSSFIANASSSSDDSSVPMGFEFEFSARFGSAGPVHTGSMSSADELFLNGKIRPMKLSTHLERPQVLAPLLDLEHENDDEDDDANTTARGRDLRFRDKSLRRRTRSMSPMRSFQWIEAEAETETPAAEQITESIVVSDNNVDGYNEEDDEESESGLKLKKNSSSASAPSSRSSSAGRNSKRWLFLKEFLRSKSEGRSNHKYFWSNISTKDKKNSPSPSPPPTTAPSTSSSENVYDCGGGSGGGRGSVSSPVNGSGKKAAGRVKPANGVVEKSKNKKKKTYELHYTANRAQAEELRRKTYLPYRQGLLGCLGFSSKGYGAVNGLARALNPVSSR